MKKVLLIPLIAVGILVGINFYPVNEIVDYNVGRSIGGVSGPAIWRISGNSVGTITSSRDFYLGGASSESSDDFVVDVGNNTIEINGVTYAFPSADGSVNNSLNTDGSGNLSWGASKVASNSTDWDEIVNAMTLDTTTTIDMDTNSADLNFDSGTLYIDNAGRVGIGTTSPDSMLSFGTTNPTITADTSDGSDNAVFQIGGGGLIGNTRGAYINLYGNEHSTAGDLQIHAGDVSGGDIRMFTDAVVERLTILESTGNVGVGVTTPTTKFEVSGSASISANFEVGSTASAQFFDGTAFSGIDCNDQTDQLFWSGGTFTCDTLDVSDDLNLTAGTDLTLTDDDLSLDSTLTQAFTFSNTGSQSITGSLDVAKGLDINGTIDIADDKWLGLGQTEGRIEFDDQATDEINILNARLGLGTAAPTKKLHIVSENTNTDPLLIDASDGSDLFTVSEDALGDVFMSLYGRSEDLSARLYVINNYATFSLYDTGVIDILLNPAGDSYIRDGNVGIGATSPASQITSPNRLLEISGSSALLALDENGAQEFNIYNSGAGIYMDIAGDGTATNNFLAIRTEETNSQYTPTERVRIQSDGNVGIGTTAPEDNLEIKDSSAGARLILDGSADSDLQFEEGSADAWLIGYDVSENYFRFYDYHGTAGNRMVIEDSTGNVGIGTTAPEVDLHVADVIEVGRTGVQNGLVGSAGILSLGMDSNNDATNQYINFVTNSRTPGSGTELVRIQENGNVGIGTTGPLSDLDIDTTSDADQQLHLGNSGTDLYIGVSDSSANRFLSSSNNFGYFGTTGADGVEFATNNNVRMVIDSTGNVGIGSTAPGVRLDVKNTGSANAVFRVEDSSGLCNAQPTTTGLTWSCSSDRSLKKNIRDASPVLDYFNNFRIRDYEVIRTGETAKGIIAQEVLLTHPSLVASGSEGLRVGTPGPWDYVKVIQELDDKIVALEARVTDLEAGTSRPVGGPPFEKQPVELQEQGINPLYVLYAFLVGIANKIWAGIRWIFKKIKSLW